FPEGVGALVEAVAARGHLAVADRRALRAMHADVGGALCHQSHQEVDSVNLDRDGRGHGPIIPRAIRRLRRGGWLAAHLGKLTLTIALALDGFEFRPEAIQCAFCFGELTLRVAQMFSERSQRLTNRVEFAREPTEIAQDPLCAG